MSQIYKPLTSSGPIPPIIPTQFTADDASIAIPAANNLNIFSRDTSDNNDNGIQTTADPNLSDNLYVELTNRITGIVTTLDATPTTIITFPLGAVPGGFFINGDVVAFDVTDVAGGSYSFVSGIRTTGAAGIEIGTEFKDVLEEAAMMTADFTVSVSGNDLIISVIGIAGKTINWNCYLTYRFVG